MSAQTYTGDVAVGGRADVRELPGLTIAKLAVPDKYLKATRDNAPETNSEAKFRNLRGKFGTDPATGRRRGLRTAMREDADSFAHRPNEFFGNFSDN